MSGATSTEQDIDFDYTAGIFPGIQTSFFHGIALRSSSTAAFGMATIAK